MKFPHKVVDDWKNDDLASWLEVVGLHYDGKCQDMLTLAKGLFQKMKNHGLIEMDSDLDKDTFNQLKTKISTQVSCVFKCRFPQFTGRNKIVPVKGQTILIESKINNKKLFMEDPVYAQKEMEHRKSYGVIIFISFNLVFHFFLIYHPSTSLLFSVC